MESGNANDSRIHYSIYGLILLLIVLLFLAGCDKQQDPVSKTDILLDTVVSVTLYDGSEEDLAAAFEYMTSLADKLDAFDDSSEISQISTVPTVLSDEIYHILKESQEFSGLTDDSFDPVLGNLILLWNIDDADTKSAPSEEAVEESLLHSSNSLLVLDDIEKSAVLLDDQAKVNLGACAKGFIADELKTFLNERGVNNALINLGGNILLIGEKSEETSWNIGIDNPFDPSAAPWAVLKDVTGSIVTSGDYQRYFTDENGVRYHHILDPGTGYPADNGLKQVVVIDDSSTEADLLSTALFVMGKEKALAFLNDFDPDETIGAVFVESDGAYTLYGRAKTLFSVTEDSEQFHEAG